MTADNSKTIRGPYILRAEAVLWNDLAPSHFLIFNSNSKIQIPSCRVYFVPISVTDFFFLGFTTLKKLLYVVKMSEQFKSTCKCLFQSAVRSVKNSGVYYSEYDFSFHFSFVAAFTKNGILKIFNLIFTYHFCRINVLHASHSGHAG